VIDVHDHITDRLNRARLEVELKRSVRPFVITGIGALIGLVCWGYLLIHMGHGIFGSNFNVAFTVDNASAVVAGRDDVQYKGIRVGTITATQLVHGHAVLTAQIDSKYGPIYTNAQATLRPKTALQNMVLDIVDRGTRAAGIAQPNDPLPASQTDSGVSIQEVLQAFNPNVRAHLGETLAQLGLGLQDRGASLRQAFIQAVPFVQVASRITQQLSLRASMTKTLVSNLTALTTELGNRSHELHRLVAKGSQTVTTLQQSSGDLGATLGGLPPTLDQLNSAFAALRRVLPPVDYAASRLRPVASSLPTTLRALRRLSAEMNPALDSLQQPVQRLQPLSLSLRPFSAHVSQAMQRLKPQVAAVDHVTRTVADCTLAIYGYMQWTASVAKFMDARGIFPRGDAELSLNSASGGTIRDPNVNPDPGCSPGLPITNTP
jgi:ABC-type transporter Mla subunit MlaD